MSSRFASSVLLLGMVGLLGCATPSRAKKPLTGEAGKPIPVSILAAHYLVPSQIDVQDHNDLPGQFVFEYVDRVTRCEGYFLFETVGTPRVHETYVKEKIESLRKDWETAGVGVVQRDETLKLLDADGRVTVLELTKAGDSASAALVDHHFPDQNLAVVAYTFCSDPGLLKSQVQTLAAVVNSQKRP
jgi:hypothetical protein